MTASILTPTRAFAEVQFPMNFLFLDKMGAIANSVSNFYDKTQINAEGVSAESGPGENALFRASNTSFWIAKRSEVGDVDLTVLIKETVKQFDAFSKVLALKEYSRIGLRVYFLETYPTVDKAIAAFKQRYLNYANNPFKSVAGMPTKCIINFGTKEDAITKDLTITPIRDERHSVGPKAGAILLNLDIAITGNIEISKYRTKMQNLVKISIETANAFIETPKRSKRKAVKK